MRLTLLAAGLLLAVSANHGYAQVATVININVLGNGSNADVSVDGMVGVDTPLPSGGSVFNEITGIPDFDDLLDAAGVATGIGVVPDLNGNSNFSFSQSDNVPIIQNYWAGNINFASPPIAATSSLTFSGFDPGSLWEIAIVSQGDADGQGGIFTIGGESLTSLGSDANGDLVDADGNTLTDTFTEGVNFVRFAEVTASVTGEIMIDIAPNAVNEEFVAINAIQLISEGDIIDACDVNRNGICNTTDFEIIRDSLFQFDDGSAARINGDLDGDGDVDFGDFRVFKDDADRVLGVDAANALVAAAAITVPEPGSLALVGLGALVLLAPARRAGRV